MGALVLGAVVLVLILLALRGAVSLDPKALVNALRTVAAIVLAFVALWVFLERSLFGGVVVAGFAWFVYRGGKIWPARRASADVQPPPASGPMTREQALEILGLTDPVATDDIQAAHHRLMQQYHPDHGGSDYLAAQINAARDFLLAD
ncbi:MAG TPA: hypothetical protein VHZ29_02040 [Rhizomicrobium sp.]|jgi:threonine/homoserine/homoserine lactone efflux protein|nr:hypothetical protein [Rhizomicrobium sp.]